MDGFVGCMSEWTSGARYVGFDCKFGVVVGCVEWLGFVLRLDRWEA